MFFYVSKLLWFVTAPSTLLLGAVFLGLILMRTRAHRFGWRLAMSAIVLTLVIGTMPIGSALFFILESRFPTLPQTGLNPAGIIVLGGAIDDIVGRSRGQVSLDEAAERMTEGAALARLYPQAKLVFTGGSNSLTKQDGTEADEAIIFWKQLGLDPARIQLEDRSRNTYENAIFTRDLVKPLPGQVWLLVTSAYHMPRAAGLFRAAGFPVKPYPVDYRTEADVWRLRPTPSLMLGLNRFDSGVREWLGLAAYWLTGKTDALLPGP